MAKVSNSSATSKYVMAKQQREPVVNAAASGPAGMVCSVNTFWPSRGPGLFVYRRGEPKDPRHRLNDEYVSSAVSAGIVTLSVVMGRTVWYLGGTSPDPAAGALANEKTLEFVTGYLVEKALAVDNIFVFLMLFTYFAVPTEFQKLALMIGIVGALLLRAAMIRFSAGSIELFASRPRMTASDCSRRSMACAILGLRAMYFLLASMHEKFHLLAYGLAIVLSLKIPQYSAEMEPLRGSSVRGVLVQLA